MLLEENPTDASMATCAGGAPDRATSYHAGREAPRNATCLISAVESSRVDILREAERVEEAEQPSRRPIPGRARRRAASSRRAPRATKAAAVPAVRREGELHV